MFSYYKSTNRGHEIFMTLCEQIWFFFCYFFIVYDISIVNLQRIEARKMYRERKWWTQVFKRKKRPRNSNHEIPLFHIIYYYSLALQFYLRSTPTISCSYRVSEDASIICFQLIIVNNCCIIERIINAAVLVVER